MRCGEIRLHKKIGTNPYCRMASNLQTPKEKKNIYFSNKPGLFKTHGSWGIMLNLHPQHLPPHHHHQWEDKRGHRQRI